MKWLQRFASSQRNIDLVAKWVGGTVMVLAALLSFLIIAATIFK
jgi:hypothetical protein